MRRLVLSAQVAVWAALSVAHCQASAQTDSWSARPRLSGSAEWEYYHSDGVSQGEGASYDALRQKYSVDLAGTVWDPRFNRYSLGIDVYRSDRRADGQELDSTSLGYRAVTTLFPQRPFPLRLFSRRSTIDSTGASLSDSDRETSAWGGEWNIVTRLQQKVSLQFERSSYDLLSPVALRERRSTGTFDYTQRFDNSEIGLRYGVQDNKELVLGSNFERRYVQLHDRFRFDGGTSLVFSASRALSEARFSSGEEDSLLQSRFMTALDVPRRGRVGVSFSYDFNGTDGKFVDSDSHALNARASVKLGKHWESTAGASAGRVRSTTSSGEIEQDREGASVGTRYNREWRPVRFGAAYAFGVSRSRFNLSSDRTVTSHSMDVETTFPLSGRNQLFSSLSYRQDENDATGVGFTSDELRASAGFEAGIGSALTASGSIYRRDATYETFEFGIQESRETGLETSLAAPRGSVSLSVSTRDGVSDFIPDPSSSTPFTPGADLVNHADIATLGTIWKLPRGLQVRAQARLENREYTSIGKERVVTYRPELEWNYRVWTFSLGLTHYERDNSTTFEQNTLLARVSRRFF
jgi:hypothetical protein